MHLFDLVEYPQRNVQLALDHSIRPANDDGVHPISAADPNDDRRDTLTVFGQRAIVCAPNAEALVKVLVEGIGDSVDLSAFSGRWNLSPES